MKRILLVLFAVLLSSCSGVMWSGEGEPRNAGNSGTLTIRLFENDPIMQYIIERNRRHNTGDHSMCGDHYWLEGWEDE